MLKIEDNGPVQNYLMDITLYMTGTGCQVVSTVLKVEQNFTRYWSVACAITMKWSSFFLARCMLLIRSKGSFIFPTHFQEYKTLVGVGREGSKALYAFLKYNK